MRLRWLSESLSHSAPKRVLRRWIYQPIVLFQLSNNGRSHVGHPRLATAFAWLQLQIVSEQTGYFGDTSCSRTTIPLQSTCSLFGEKTLLPIGISPSG